MGQLVYNEETNEWQTGDDLEFTLVPMTHCRKCGCDSVVYRQEAYGDSWVCVTAGCTYYHYYSLGD